MISKTVIGPVVMVASTVGVPVLMSSFLGWWTILWAPLVLLLIGAAIVVIQVFWPSSARVRTVSDFNVAEEADEAEPEPVFRHQICPVGLSSAKEDYEFLFSATVCRRGADLPAGDHENTEALATDLVLHRARALALKAQPVGHDLVEHQLAAALGEPLRDARTGNEVWAEDVSLTLSEDDVNRLNRLAASRKEREVWQHERDAERDRRDYLGCDVLATPGSALVWWLARNMEKVKEADSLIDTFVRISATAAGKHGLPGSPDSEWTLAKTEAETFAMPMAAPWSGSPEAAGDRVEWNLVDHASALVDTVADRSGADDKDGFTDRLALLLRDYGEKDLAQRLRQKYGSPDLSGDAEPFRSGSPDVERAGAPSGSSNGETPAGSEKDSFNGFNPDF